MTDAAERYQYRVLWRREGLRPTQRLFARDATARRFLLLFGDEPWRAYLKHGEAPDDLVCCAGHECGCGGHTYRQQAEDRRKHQPALLYARVERRRVGSWETDG